ncbi:metalloregulator ArsR/SmtB family transcription factor [Rhizobium sp. BG4]|uniref:ArsR/SmtB family transcription factor n=1 Tax=Rhizobium sp. BG4 TaxID=2613770 RepID=UPI001FED55D7|nr:metalloregulator ArsR/SmtB family transcription factor [Rhizobium sp. BG4]
MLCAATARPTTKMSIMHPDLIEKSKLLSAMANPVRLKILSIISNEEIRVSELGERLEINQSALSQHLSILREGGLVVTRREAQSIFYSTGHPGVLKLLRSLKDIYAAPMSE